MTKISINPKIEISFEDFVIQVGYKLAHLPNPQKEKELKRIYYEWQDAKKMHEPKINKNEAGDFTENRTKLKRNKH